MMFETEDMLCPWVHHLASVELLQIWWQWQQSSSSEINSGVKREVTLWKVNNFSFHVCIILHDHYLCRILNGTPFIRGTP
jgi:hypothetical protein